MFLYFYKNINYYKGDFKMTREEFEAILQEAYEAGQEDAYEEVEAALQESEEIEIEDGDIFDEEFNEFDFDMDEEAYTEALALKKRLNNVPGPREAYQGLRGMASRGGANFKKGVNSFRKRVLGKAGQIGKSASGKFDDARKKLIKAKAKALLKMKNL